MSFYSSSTTKTQKNMNVTIFFSSKRTFLCATGNELLKHWYCKCRPASRVQCLLHCGLIKCFLKSAEAQRKTSIQKRKEKIRLFSVKEAQSRDWVNRHKFPGSAVSWTAACHLSIAGHTTCATFLVRVFVPSPSIERGGSHVDPNFPCLKTVY